MRDNHARSGQQGVVPTTTTVYHPSCALFRYNKALQPPHLNILIIRIALGLVASAFFALLIDKLLLWWHIPFLPELATRLGIGLLFLGFGILLCGGLVMLGRLVYSAEIGYFSAPQRQLRRLLFTANYQENLKQRFYWRKRKVAINNDAKRQRLLQADNRKHIKSLGKAIQRDLSALKRQLPQADYLQLEQELKAYRQELNADDLIALQVKIANLGKQ